MDQLRRHLLIYQVRVRAVGKTHFAGEVEGQMLPIIVPGQDLQPPPSFENRGACAVETFEVIVDIG